MLLVGAAPPPLVQRENAKVLSQAGCCLRPLTGVAREAVEEQDRRPMSAKVAAGEARAFAMTFDPISHKTKLLRVTEQWQSLSSALIEIRQRSISPKAEAGAEGDELARSAQTTQGGEHSDERFHLGYVDQCCRRGAAR